MGLAELENLARIGTLKAEPGTQLEFDGLLRSGMARLRDAKNTSNSIEGRFDLAYNAAHALSLAALRWHGYRSENRYLVFQSLTHTLNLPAEQWRVLDQAQQIIANCKLEGVRVGIFADTPEALARWKAAGVDFDNVMLAPVNKGILVKNSGRTDIRRLRGQCFTTGVEYDEIYDVARIALPIRVRVTSCHRTTIAISVTAITMMRTSETCSGPHVMPFRKSLPPAMLNVS